MQYYCYIVEDIVLCKLENKVVAKFEVETFFINVISPLEFKRFERNPDKRLFNIRKLEFNIYKLK
jgi:hypothetical protein